MNLLATPIKTDERIPTIPAVVARLLAVYSNDNFTIEDVVNVLNHAPGVSARVLRMANSPFFGFSRQVFSTHDAAVLLGRGLVQGLALGTVLLKPWGMRLPPEPVWAIWSHSYLCGFGCRVLALQSGERAQHSSFEALSVAGLLHDIGKIIILARHPEEYAAMLEEAETAAELLERERALFGYDHAEIGCDAMMAWEMPELFSAVAGGHYQNTMRGEYSADVELLRLVHAIVEDEPIEALAHGFSPAAVETTKIKLLEARGAAEEFCKIVYPA